MGKRKIQIDYDNPKYQWHDIFYLWNRISGFYDSQISKNGFLNLSIKSKDRSFAGTKYTVWWHRYNVSYYLSELAKNPQRCYSDYNSGGLNHTVWLLDKYKDDNEKSTLIWLTAIVRHICEANDLWLYNDIHEFSEFWDVLFALNIQFEKYNIPYWDGRSRTLIPKSIIFNTKYEFTEVFRINTLRDFLALLAIEIIGIQSKDQLVNVEII